MEGNNRHGKPGKQGRWNVMTDRHIPVYKQYLITYTIEKYGLSL